MASGKSDRILTCDDHAHITKLVELTLRKRGFEVEACRDGASAWESMTEHPPRLLISDCEMPGMSGLELCNMVRLDRRLCDLPIILLTAKAFHLCEEKLQRSLNITAVVKKPFSPRKLGELVATTLQQHAPDSAEGRQPANLE